MTRRTKAALVAGLMALGLIVGVRKASADDEWLRIACALCERNSITWVLLGCYNLPDDVHSPQG